MDGTSFRQKTGRALPAFCSRGQQPAPMLLFCAFKKKLGHHVDREHQRPRRRAPPPWWLQPAGDDSLQFASFSPSRRASGGARKKNTSQEVLLAVVDQDADAVGAEVVPTRATRRPVPAGPALDLSCWHVALYTRRRRAHHQVQPYGSVLDGSYIHPLV